MEHGYLAIVLHAHLPFVRDPEHQDPLAERWLHEAITESYLPLLLIMEKLVEDGIDFRLTLSVSPPLAAMLSDPLRQSRYARALQRSIELAQKEEHRTKQDSRFHPLARMYYARFVHAYDAFVDRYGGNLLNGFRRFSDLGKVDLMTTAATHGYLPLLSVNESAVRAQIRIGIEQHRRLFGCKPKGFWLPECGFYPGVDRFLREEDIWFTILETHGITRATNRPRYGVYAPIFTPSGVAAFGRDPDSSRQVWSSTEGYPGDYDYREFYRDIGHDLDLEYIRPYILPAGVRVDTGLKYFRITGKDGHKEHYIPEWAESKAAAHAEHFLSAHGGRMKRLRTLMDRTPITVAPYDAELFGHWWFEGPLWLDHVIRKTASGRHGIRLTTLTEYLKEFPTNQTAEPCMSSWGVKGFNEVWLNEKTQWIYPHLHAAAEMMNDVITLQPRPADLTLRAMNQAARELMLAQASDWAFMISGGAMKDYATSRTEQHLLAFQQLCRQLEAGAVDDTQLELLERTDNIFHELPVAEAFQKEAEACAVEALPAAKPVADVAHSAGRPLHIAMLCPEILPFAKTGGLADMVSSLAVALERAGQRVTLLMPAYRSAFSATPPLEDTGMRVAVSIGGKSEVAEILTATIGPQIPVYFIRADRYFNREFLYGTAESDYADNAERFAFFARAALEVLGRIDFPDILHAHDWQTALAIAFLKTQPERYPGLVLARTVFTIHNLGYQGLFPFRDWDVLGLDPSLFNPGCVEFYGNINFLKAGLVFADALTTVSPTYAREIRTPEFGFGLEGILEQRGAQLTGILNGADYDVWSPSVDQYIVERYSANDPSGKSACKADLQRILGMEPNPSIPLIGAVSRLASQKGFDLVASVFDSLLQQNVQFALLGTGERSYQDYFAAAAARYAPRVGVHIGYEEVLAHKIIAGADMFLMPSRYEPGGLTQLYSLKYGTIPIVRATGGLQDSIQEFDAATRQGNGFRFGPYDAASLLRAVNRALAAFGNSAQWTVLMKNALTADYSWNRSALDYLNLYHGILQR